MSALTTLLAARAEFEYADKALSESDKHNREERARNYLKAHEDLRVAIRDAKSAFGIHNPRLTP